MPENVPMIPFQETPAQEKPASTQAGISATELFSMFTADIICAKKIFVR
jgi:hypothetical protein